MNRPISLPAAVHWPQQVSMARKLDQKSLQRLLRSASATRHACFPPHMPTFALMAWKGVRYNPLIEKRRLPNPHGGMSRNAK